MVDSSGTDAIERAKSRGEPSDETLLAWFRERAEVAALETLVERYGPAIYSYLLRFLRNTAMAEDAFQRTFLRLCEKSHLFASTRRVRPWLYSIATHQAIDMLRREGRHQAVSLSEVQTVSDGQPSTLQDLLTSSEPSPLEQLESTERREWARRAVDGLPEDLRVVVLLIYYQGLKYREVAEALDLPLGTVKSRCHKALLELHRAWRRDYPDAKG